MLFRSRQVAAEAGRLRACCASASLAEATEKRSARAEAEAAPQEADKVSACGHAVPRTCESEAARQRQVAAGVGPRRKIFKVGAMIRKRTIALLIGVGVGVLLARSPTSAHHAFTAEFDANQPVTLRGTVTKMEWVNPHSWIYLDVKKADGTVESWAVEAGAPNAMFRRGWNKNSIPVGIEIVVDGYRAKNGTNTANGRDVLLPDGRKLFVGSSGTGTPLDGRDSGERK